jgi:hypothetical protein
VRAALLAMLAIPSASLLDAADNSGWRTIDGPSPPARSIHWAAFDARRDRVLMGGGWDGVRFLTDLWQFSLITETWSQIQTSGENPSPRFAASAVVDDVRDRLLLLFGFDGSASGEVWALNLATHRWSRATLGPPARMDAVATSQGRRLWVYGGFAGLPPTESGTLGDLWELDLDSDSWRKLEAIGEVPPPRTNAALAFRNGSIWLLGGHDATSAVTDVWRYELISARWQRVEPIGTRRAWAHFSYAQATDEVCGRLLTVGGDVNDGRSTSRVESLSLSEVPRFTSLSEDIPSLARDHAAAAFDPVRRQLIVFAGAQSGLILGDTRIFTLSPCGTRQRAVRR